MTEPELNQKLMRIFYIGTQIGNYQSENKPVSWDTVQEKCDRLFTERDKLIADIQATISA